MNNLVNVSKSFLKRNASTILTCIGAAGVIATSIAAVKATPKAEMLLREAEEEKGDKLTLLEMVQTSGSAYIPSLLIGASTIACIFGANVLNTRQQATLMSAYGLLETSYKEYGKKVKELYGEEADSKVKEEVTKEHYTEIPETIPEGKQLFFDFKTLNYFESTMDEVLQKVTMDDGLECYIINTPFDSMYDYM